ncbi:MAG: response regulator transcription factor [Balneolaceae bacterium]
MLRKTDNDYKLIRVVIVEDNNYIREGWTTILDSDPEICILNSYESCEEALEDGEFRNSDILLLDINLPGMQGTEGIVKFLDQNSALSVIMATVFEDNHHVFEALENGAIGYLMKKVTPDELIRAVKDANEGGSPMSPNIARKIISSLQAKSQSSKEYRLNDREKEILQLLGEGKSYSAIAKKIFLSVDGVGYHIRNIYRKLQVNGKSQAIAKGVSEGLIELG